MKQGSLSNYFKGVAAKRLSLTEIDPDTSHGHEFQGVNRLRAILGDADRKFDARIIYLGDSEDDTLYAQDTLSWYDSRRGKPRAAEYRLYYPSSIESVSHAARGGDLFIVGLRSDDSLLSIIVKSGSTVERQLIWLFGLSPALGNGYSVESIVGEKDKPLNYAAKFILDELGIEVEDTEPDFVEELNKRFNMKFPTTSEFSAFARQTLPAISSLDNPDQVLMLWMEREESLFKTLEHQIVATTLKKGFSDVDTFIEFSLSVHNRRKSRAGFALENHIEQIFRDHKIKYKRHGVTENNVKPDFVFPGIEEYHNAHFPEDKLTMLGTKSTCKDRWRQVLSEAARIKSKHLPTLEPGISSGQITEMKTNFLQPAVPAPTHGTYSNGDRTWLMNVAQFVKMVKSKQSKK